MIGLNTALAIAPTAVMVPAAAGSMPATVVRKKIRKVPVKVYTAASPAPADAYPIFVLLDNLSIVRKRRDALVPPY